MKKLLLSIVLSMVFAATPAMAAVFVYEETFDNPADFPGDATLPDGWKSEGSYPFHRGKAADFGATAHSGDYVLGTTASPAFGRNEVVYTRAISLKGGTPCTVDFSLWAPGGVPATVRNSQIVVTACLEQTSETQTIAVGQTPAAATTDWTTYSFTFTPTADGTYYIAFAVIANLGQSGAVLLDNIAIKGEAPGDSKPDNDTVNLPYSQDFENENGDYDGTSFLPKGWTAIGSTEVQTASFATLPAQSGLWYLVALDGEQPRDESVFTPSFAMKAGKSYNVGFYLYMPGSRANGYLRVPEMNLSAGTGSTLEQQDTILSTIKGEELKQWTKVWGKFTPPKDGNYCFAISFSSIEGESGPFAIDLFTVAEENKTVPVADFVIDAWRDYRDSRLVVMDNEKIKMTNLSENAESYLWTVEGAEPASSTEQNPAFTFPKEGKYTITLTAKNGDTEKKAYKEVDIELLNSPDTQQLPLASFDASADKILYNSTMMPTFATEPTYDFVSGINHYYRRFAERFTMPEGTKMTIGSITTWLVAYSRMMDYTPELRNHPFTIAMYGETNGRLDENKLYGKKESTVVDEFGSIGIGLENSKQMGFDLSEKPITVEGTFYIAFEFDDKMPIDSDDPNIIRSYVSLAMLKHKSGATTLFAKPTAGPEGFEPDGGWYSVDQIQTDLKGYGLYLVLWGRLSDYANSIVAVDSNGHIAFAARTTGDLLQVSGTAEGETVEVYNLGGQLVLKAPGKEYSTTLPANNLPQGTYIVKCGDKSCKVSL